MEAPKSEDDMELLLYELVTSAEEEAGRDDPEYTSEVANSFRDVNARTFEAAGILTTDRGLVVRFPSGEEFQLTIKRSR